MESIGFLERNWVRDASGVAHAIRQTEWPFHSAMCGKWLKGDFVKPEEFNVTRRNWGVIAEPVRRCPECCDRLHHAIPKADEQDGDYTPRCVILGRGIEREVGRRGKR